MFYRAEPAVEQQIKARFKLKDQAAVLDFFDVDAVPVGLIRQPQYIRAPDAQGFYEDIFGNTIQSVQYGETSTAAVVKSVLAGAEDIAEIEKMSWPGDDFVNIEASRREATQARATGRAVYGGVWASLFTTARSIMGEEHFLLSTICNPEFVSALIERLAQFYLQVNAAYFSNCRDNIDVFYFGSDFGTQASMFISRDMFCRFFKPSFKRLVAQAKGYGLKVMYHTCGAVSDIVPDLVECGIDILDPVQVSAAKMAPALLAQKFKGRIAFHGGISTQTTLPFGTAGEVHDQVCETIRTLGPLGYVVAPDQEMIGNVPPENIGTMFKAAREFKL
jgi:uroporphyrinogen decarboxylase